MNKVDFETLVHIAMKIEGDTQSSLSEKLGCKQPAISHILKGSVKNSPLYFDLEEYTQNALLTGFSLIFGEPNKSQKTTAEQTIYRSFRQFVERNNNE